MYVFVEYILYIPVLSITYNAAYLMCMETISRNSSHNT